MRQSIKLRLLRWMISDVYSKQFKLHENIPIYFTNENEAVQVYV